ncbi:MAG: hypothetical protein HC911_01545 [Chloroflexaceae bacterium]|nr:hypothetical protein [Chloroflexaceae bacterium]
MTQPDSEQSATTIPAPAPAPAPSGGTEQITLGRILISDFRLNQLLGMAVLMTLFGVAIAFLTRYSLFGLLLLALGIAATVALVVRVNWFQSILDHPVESTATVQRIGRSWLPRRGRYRYAVRYSYSHNGVAYKGRTMVYTYPDQITFRAGDQLRLTMHRDKPQHSFLPDLYPN